MKLTEAKLKQMIVEALRKKYDGRDLTWVDDNIPTPDEKLRAMNLTKISIRMKHIFVTRNRLQSPIILFIDFYLTTN